MIYGILALIPVQKKFINKMTVISDQQKTLFEKSIVAFGTCDKNCKPNVNAVAACKVVSDNQVLVTDNFLNKTRINLAENNLISLSF